METITNADYESRLEENSIVKEITYDCRGYDCVSRYVNKWADENYNVAKFHSGIELELHDQKFHQDLNIENQHDDFFDAVLTSKFYLSGHEGVISPGIENTAAEYSERGGQNYLFYLPDIEELEQNFTGDRVQSLVVHMDADTLRNFTKSLDDIPQLLKPLIESKKSPRFHHPVGNLTSTMQTIVEQIWHHPYQGAIARMYLEGKVLELLALQLSQLLQSESSLFQPKKLTVKDIDRLNMAKDILQQNYYSPPSVMELAQQVELEHMKLKRGFRQQFNTTPFGYVRNHRLEQAYQLLKEGNLTVSMVVSMVGYSNVGHFSNAFKRKYGITPGQCRAA